VRPATAPKLCAVPDCDSKAEAKSLCWLHFGRLRRNGDPLASGQHGGRRSEIGPQANVPDPGPARVLREALERQRLLGNNFRWACSTALMPALQVAGPERTGWFEVFHAHRNEWRLAFLNLPTERPFPVGALGPVMDDRDPHPHERRSGPPLVLSGARHDAPGQLEPVAVPWCS